VTHSRHVHRPSMADRHTRAPLAIPVRTRLTITTPMYHQKSRSSPHPPPVMYHSTVSAPARGGGDAGQQRGQRVLISSENRARRRSPHTRRRSPHTRSRSPHKGSRSPHTRSRSPHIRRQSPSRRSPRKGGEPPLSLSLSTHTHAHTQLTAAGARWTAALGVVVPSGLT